MAFQNPVIVIPGITATDLVDDYPTRSDEVWSMVLNKAYERVALHPDDLRFEAIEPAHVFPGQAFSIYDGLIGFLRHELSARADRPTPVFAFPYDWRVDVRITAARLRPFLDEVLARTRLLKHYRSAPSDLAVDLVGHSMGGLVICECLAQDPKAPVGNVVTLGTPYLGSVEAIVKITTGMSLLSGSAPEEREREAARVTPAVYQLFPSYPGAARDGRGDVDLFNPQNIQTSVVDSLAEFVRLYSAAAPAARRARALELLTALLSGAKAHRQTVAAFRLPKNRPATRWLAVAGIGQKTRVQVSVDRGRRGPRFRIDDDQFVNEVAPAIDGLYRTGDGTVPLNGALPPFLDPSHVVCVSESDLGLLELRDRLLGKLGGFHGLLPAVNLVQHLTTKHLKPDFKGPVWGRRIPGSPSWQPPIRGLKEKDAPSFPRRPG